VSSSASRHNGVVNDAAQIPDSAKTSSHKAASSTSSIPPASLLMKSGWDLARQLAR